MEATSWPSPNAGLSYFYRDVTGFRIWAQHLDEGGSEVVLSSNEPDEAVAA